MKMKKSLVEGMIKLLRFYLYAVLAPFSIFRFF